jgi:hypothetical protein
VASELLYALSLGATCLAYEVDLNLAQLVFVTQCLWTFYLLPVWGYVSLRRLTRKRSI